MSWINGAENDDAKLGGSGPGFTRYTTDEFDQLRRQHNIMVLVGNGFDIQALHDYGQPVDSRYEPFYHYLKMRNFDSENVLFHHMGEELKLHQKYGGHSDWSNVEAAISAALEDNPNQVDKVFADLQTVQAAFAQFLQMVATSNLLDRIGADASKHGWSVESLSQFLKDIVEPEDFKSLDFPARVYHYDLFNYLFVNFNYTTLLDNYLYLDQDQFDPLGHKTVDTHFWFKNDPRSHWAPGKEPDDGYSSYVTANVVHPHGILSTPRSLLFGIDADDDYKKTRSASHYLKKPYWSQAHALYRKHFTQADLFIIFGCSLGESDGWWWRNIVRALRATKTQTYTTNHPTIAGEVVKEHAELIIYQRQENSQHTSDSVKDRFLTAAGLAEDDEDRESIADRIHVVTYDDQTPRTFLNTRCRDSEQDEG